MDFESIFRVKKLLIPPLECARFRFAMDWADWADGHFVAFRNEADQSRTAGLKGQLSFSSAVD
jgi:hypothetical protein